MKKHIYPRILYAEDREDASFMMTTVLEFSDIEVTAVRTIADAWQLAQSEYFDLYLLDSRFPDGSGFELCRWLREYNPSTPVIIYSDDTLESEVQEGFASGAADYLIKPYFQDLGQTILATIELSKTQVVKVAENSPVESLIMDETRVFTEVLTWNPQI